MSKPMSTIARQIFYQGGRNVVTAADVEKEREHVFIPEVALTALLPEELDDAVTRLARNAAAKRKANEQQNPLGDSEIDLVQALWEGRHDRVVDLARQGAKLSAAGFWVVTPSIKMGRLASISHLIRETGLSLNPHQQKLFSEGLTAIALPTDRHSPHLASAVTVPTASPQ